MYIYIEYIEDPDLNPLYHATELCVGELTKCVDKVTNANELPKLLVTSSYPFVRLTRKGDVYPSVRRGVDRRREPLCDVIAHSNSNTNSNTNTNSTSNTTTTNNNNINNSNSNNEHKEEKKWVNSKIDINDGQQHRRKRRRTSPESVIDLSSSPS